MYHLYKKAFKTVKHNLSKEQYNALYTYKTCLQSWNKVMNLTTVDDDMGILWRHFIDSCKILEFINIKHMHCILDLGTGAGFPGLPIKIITNCETTLVDALNKRIKFLDAVVKECCLKNVKAIHSRVESLAHKTNYRSQYDYVFARAVTNLSVLLEYSIPFLKIGGYFIAYKSDNLSEEINSAKNAMTLLNTSLVDRIAYKDYDENSRTFLIFKKNKENLSDYPRKIGIPVKKPL